MSLTVVLVQPQTAGNVGAICRLMKNFGVSELVLLDPQCELGDEARRRAKHAVEVLDASRTVATWDEAVSGCELVVGSTAIRASERNVRRSHIGPRQLGERLAGAQGRTALVLGREGEGLHADELERCELVVTIPASPEYGTLNISQAAAVILYELWVGRQLDEAPYELAGADEKEVILRSADTLMDELAFSEQRVHKIQLVLRRVLAKSFLTRQEAFGLAGFFRTLADRTEDRDNDGDR